MVLDYNCQLKGQPPAPLFHVPPCPPPPPLPFEGKLAYCSDFDVCIAPTTSPETNPLVVHSATLIPPVLDALVVVLLRHLVLCDDCAFFRVSWQH